MSPQQKMEALLEECARSPEATQVISSTDGQRARQFIARTLGALVLAGAMMGPGAALASEEERGVSVGDVHDTVGTTQRLFRVGTGVIRNIGRVGEAIDDKNYGRAISAVRGVTGAADSEVNRAERKAASQQREADREQARAAREAKAAARRAVPGAQPLPASVTGAAVSAPAMTTASYEQPTGEAPQAKYKSVEEFHKSFGLGPR